MIGYLPTHNTSIQVHMRLASGRLRVIAEFVSHLSFGVPASLDRHLLLLLPGEKLLDNLLEDSLAPRVKPSLQTFDLGCLHIHACV